MAAYLPLEIVQSFLLHLDVETYIAARQTCRSWRCAASAPYMFSKALQQVPVSLPPTISTLTQDQWTTYFAQITRLNLLHCRQDTKKSVTQRDLPHECSATTVVGTSTDGRKLVTLKGGRATLYERANLTSPWEYSRGMTLCSQWTSVARAMLEGGTAGCMSINQRYAKQSIAVSSQGDLIAVGLGRTIQIYSLRKDQHLLSPAEYVLGQDSSLTSTTRGQYEDTDGVVDSLEFADDDTLLRISINKETTIHQPTRVRYLGCPDLAQNQPDLNYWRANINRIYLDSAALSVALAGQDEYRLIFRGLRLLPPSYLATQQQEQEDQQTSPPTPRYFVASLQSGVIHGEGTPTPPIRLLPPRRRHHSTRTEELPPLNPPLPSSRCDEQHITYNLLDTVPRWSAANLPSATFPSPLLSISTDHKILALYEPSGNYSPAIVSGGSLYLYCLENCRPIYQPGPQRFKQPTQKTSLPHQRADSPEDKFSVDARYPPPDIVPSWPFLLDKVPVDIDSLEVKRSTHDDGVVNSKSCAYTVTARSGGQVLEWRMSA
ncbi:hypothetical protein ANOM_011287 [Aspergillus nomiae NRRL 13137]|uniref:F-box domain-containing protein n=1 Tax=Aspergillus nomiae NRRL (strain ATCC 15546 / NRRL 13137 / CBS 260.88 / M93) TaxID=1509407 RepID=A0A0L1IN20_ASPN3|nr:uncharacterized protein ANOM_011287 [Aspergillus nomiae NRRL 13137]KNG80705.1 hypothetical protein ANOM_011287 [Aspergillus nomiae NRRL 13137]